MINEKDREQLIEIILRNPDNIFIECSYNQYKIREITEDNDRLVLVVGRLDNPIPPIPELEVA